MQVEIVLANEGNKTYPAPVRVFVQESSLTTLSSQILDKDIQPFSKTTLTMQIGIKPEKWISDVPKYLFVNIMADNVRDIPQNSRVSLISHLFAGSLLKYDSPVNILLFGPARSGKSTSINNMIVAGSETSSPIKRSGPGHDHLDKNFTKTCFSDVDGALPIPACFFDVWGVDDNNFNDEELSLILSGDMKLGSYMNNITQENNPSNTIDAVAFVLSIEQSNPDASNQIRTRLKQFISYVSDRDYLPIVIITHAQNETFEKIQKTKQELSLFFQLETRNFVVTLIYPEDSSQNMKPTKMIDVDIVSLSVLEKLMINGQRRKDVIHKEKFVKEKLIRLDEVEEQLVSAQKEVVHLKLFLAISITVFVTAILFLLKTSQDIANRDKIIDFKESQISRLKNEISVKDKKIENLKDKLLLDLDE